MTKAGRDRRKANRLAHRRWYSIGEMTKRSLEERFSIPDGFILVGNPTVAYLPRQRRRRARLLKFLNDSVPRAPGSSAPSTEL